MADNIVGQALVKLGLEAEQFKKGIKDSQKQLNAFAGVAKKVFAGLAIGFSAKAVINGINKSVEAFRQQEIAVKSLNQALMNSGTYTYEYSQSIQKLASEIQTFSNYGDEATIKAVGLGQAMAGNVKFTNEAIKAVVDFAAAMDMDLDSAFRLVGKSIGSNTNALARYGIELDKNMTKEQKMARITEQLGNKFSGSAREMANASIQMKNALGDLSEAIGGVFNPYAEQGQKLITNWARALTDFINRVRIARTEISKLGIDELEIAYRDVNKQLNEWNQRFDEMMFGNTARKNDPHIKELEERQKNILAQIKVEKQLQKEKARTSELNKQTLELNEKIGGTDKTLDEYKKFVDGYKEATNEYKATLQAREYVQNTLSMSAIAEDYDETLNAYKEYFKQILVISQSGAANKNALLLMNEEKLQQDLQTIVLNKTTETEKKQWELIKGYQEKMKEIEINARAKEEAGGFLGSFGTGYQERLNIIKWYYQEYDKITNAHFTDTQAKADAYNQLMLIRDRMFTEQDKEIWEQRGHDIAGIFENTFSQMLTNYGDFSDNMKQLALNLIQYLLKEELAYAMKSIAYAQMRAKVISMINSIGSGIGGFFGGLFGLGKNHSGHLYVPSQKYHSGGMAADQTEHFALIKNNERVLSPAETTSYNNDQQQQGGSYIVYAPQVRAMDSKDVAQWFNENKLQVINIISQGIKNNTQGLRTQVQGV